MRLALWDVDGTLLAGDHDVEWARHLADLGVVDESPIARFHADYARGELDVDAFFAFQLAPLAQHPLERLLAWREEFFAARIRPQLRAWGRSRLERHRELGHEVVLITASNRFLTEPIAAELGCAALIASEPERSGGRYTGRLAPPPCFREGKLEHLDRWLAARGARWSDVEESWAYSDSLNDLPLLERAHHSVVVTPDSRLAEVARRRGWTELDANGLVREPNGRARG
jgi:HAD superfamily hydrolase (TIGR01490 family)